MQQPEIFINYFNCVTPIGFNADENWQNILQGNTGIKKHQFSAQLPEIYLSKINSELLEKEFEQKIGAKDFTRLEKMLALSLKPIIDQSKPTEDSILILSTTKGNINSLKNCKTPSEETYLSSLAQKIADFFGFKRTPVVISNACVSGVMAISLAKNLLQTGKYEDAFLIAADEISEFVVSGFNSFQAMSSEPCKPYDENRDGITLGEAAAATYLSKNKADGEVNFKILGESGVNDANHISGPSRTGEGLFRSIAKAMKEGNINSAQIDFISAHGTATVYNDEMESIAFTRAQLQNTPVHSLKGFYGHTLGAAGLLETIIAMESAKNNILIASKNFSEHGVSESINIIQDNSEKEIKIFMKTASGFGGCNAALILEKMV